MKLLKVVLLILILTSCSKNTESIKKQFQAPPEMNGFGKYLGSLINNGENVEFATWFYEKNKHLQSSKGFMWASEYYAIAGYKDSSALCLNLALDNGMSNYKIINQKEVLAIAKKTSYWAEIEQKLTKLENKLTTVNNFEINSEPMESFWNYYNAAIKDSTKSRKYLGEYIMNGSNATREYYAHRYKSIDEMYKIMISENLEHFLLCQKLYNNQNMQSLRKDVLSMMIELKNIYPQAIFPKVYIMPGIMDTGGTVTELGLFIGGEKFIKNVKDSAYINSKSLKKTIMHELMHFQQGYQDSVNNEKLIGNITKEGVCDFLVELCSNEILKNKNTQYLESEENLSFILNELKKDIFSNNTNKWMYNEDAKDRPVDIGYTIGYKICKSYYENSEDKSKAIYNLLNTEDFTKILQKSNYADILN